MLLSLKKVTKDPGTCECPRTPYNATQVWYAPPATNHGKFKPRSLRSSLVNFLRDFRKKIFQPAKALEIFFAFR